MTGPELQRLIQKAKTTQVGAARELEIAPRTMRSYISGRLDIPRKIEYAMLWMVHISR